MLACAPGEVLPFSTGVIMEPLPVEKIVAALPRAFDDLAPEHWFRAVSAIMTTDTVPKGASRRIAIDSVPVTVTGIAKGSGMIHPDMATMLAFIATDAPIAAGLIATATREIASVSFNCATIDGDTSTNDSFVLAATQRAAMAPSSHTDDPRFPPPRRDSEVVTELAAIVRDGEGATKVFTVRVEGGRDGGMPAHRIAVAHSPAVKTAFFASDPNLGRIVRARSATPPWPISPPACPRLDEVLVVENGARPVLHREAGQRVMKNDEIAVRVTLGRAMRRRPSDVRFFARLRPHQRRLP
jgi:glutamate N-acetyltransferase/amino-acid N-acetyltransferase